MCACCDPAHLATRTSRSAAAAWCAAAARCCSTRGACPWRHQPQHQHHHHHHHAATLRQQQQQQRRRRAATSPLHTPFLARSPPLALACHPVTGVGVAHVPAVGRCGCDPRRRPALPPLVWRGRDCCCWARCSCNGSRAKHQRRVCACVCGTLQRHSTKSSHARTRALNPTLNPSKRQHTSFQLDDTQTRGQGKTRGVQWHPTRVARLGCESIRTSRRRARGDGRQRVNR